MEVNQPSFEPTAFTDNKKSINSPPVEIRKEINGTAAEIFEAWSNPLQVKDWWGPESFTCPLARINFKVGGSYLFSMKDPEGKEIFTTGTFKEIIPNKKIVLSDFPANREGDIVPAEEAGFNGPYADLGEATIIVELKEDDGQTILNLRHEGLPERIHDDCVDGWSSSLNKLKRVVEKH